MLTHHYATLGLKPGATADAVKTAYRRLARRYHPDKSAQHAGDSGKFNAVCQAYRLVLVDAQSRSQLQVVDSLHSLDCRRRRRGSPTDRRFGWQLSEEYVGTRIICEA